MAVTSIGDLNMYRGKSVRLEALDSGLFELVLDLQDSSVNKLDQRTLAELHEAIQWLRQPESAVSGLLLSSAKPAFVVGADINEFTGLFRQDELHLLDVMGNTHRLFMDLEELPFPTVTAINGLALGGGFELALATDFRIMAKDAQVGLPEVNLGLCPGWGGTVRLSRLIGAEQALAWMMGGKPQSAERALQAGAVDRLAAHDLRAEAIALLRSAVMGQLSSQSARSHKRQPFSPPAGLEQACTARLDPHYPAAGLIVRTVMQHASLPFKEALDTEAKAFIQLGCSDVSRSLVGLFLAEQAIRRKARTLAAKAEPVRQAAVLGAGIMGGGVAFQSALSGTPIIMKDIRQEALDLGMKTASRLLDRQIEKGRLDAAGKQQVLARIRPELEYQSIDQVDLVVEAVVENSGIKASVLAEVESLLAGQAVLTSNTSTISIDLLASSLKHPEQFCGMHFFNPVHLMPLVEVIRGQHSSNASIAKTVGYASAMGKTPVVVRDCPGFLVNRILFPYFNGFNRLLREGVNFERIDRVMEAFGWPMGPAYLADVIGIDTMVHADHVLQNGFPERMKHDGEPVMEQLLARGWLGQKSGHGFYEYGIDARGQRSKTASAAASALIAEGVSAQTEDISDEEIIDRLMVPLCLEAVRCLEDGIVDSPEEADMGLILGLGFPKFRGGALRYIDTLGLATFARKAEKQARHGGLYQLTAAFRQRLQDGQTYF